MTPSQFIDQLLLVSRNANVKDRIQKVKDFMEMKSSNLPLTVVLKQLGTSFLPQISNVTSPGSGFQIKAIEALGCALWAFLTNWNSPEECIIDV